MSRRSIVVLAGLLATLALAGCQSTEPFLFIATPGYVEAQLAMSEEAIRQDYEARIADLEAELAEQKAAADELASLAGVITEVEQSNRELQELASRVEEEIQDLPYDTIEIIVQVLNRHLEGNR
jgi:uncharacterized coiled-coil protein SlyX